MQNIYEMPCTASMMAQSFWFIEFKTVVKLRHEDVDLPTIHKRCEEENLLGAINAHRSSQMAGHLLRRVKQMDAGLIDLFMASGVEMQKVINLSTMMMCDRLLFEFMNEVYRERVILGQKELSAIDTKTFFSRKEVADENIAGGNDSTKKHLGASFLNFLVEANLLTVSGKEKLITPPLIDNVLIRYMTENRMTPILRAITGVQ